MPDASPPGPFTGASTIEWERRGFFLYIFHSSMISTNRGKMVDFPIDELAILVQGLRYVASYRYLHLNCIRWLCQTFCCRASFAKSWKLPLPT